MVQVYKNQSCKSNFIFSSLFSLCSNVLSNSEISNLHNIKSIKRKNAWLKLDGNYDTEILIKFFPALINLKYPKSGTYKLTMLKSNQNGQWKTVNIS